MNVLGDGWFTEINPASSTSNCSPGDQSGSANGDSCQTPQEGLWKGQAFSLEVEKVLLNEKTKYQNILVFKSKTYGNVLALDGIIQCTERDEFAYQEMLAHLPMCSHPNPKKVLIIGGGDGGIMREVLKHDCVESAVLCEIDEGVIEASKKFLPGMAVSFSHPKATVHVGDGFKFMREHKNQFDVIITDSSDPIGPAKSLFGDAYYKLIHEALADDGVLASQGESMWLHLPLIREMYTFCREIYPSVAYGYCSTPTYPSGSIGYMVCSKMATDLTKPKRSLSDDEVLKMRLKFYNSQVHSAAFVVPQFVKDALSS